MKLYREVKDKGKATACAGVTTNDQSQLSLTWLTPIKITEDGNEIESDGNLCWHHIGSKIYDDHPSFLGGYLAGYNAALSKLKGE